MKIIKHGTGYGKEVKFECKNCGCVFLEEKPNCKACFYGNDLYLYTSCPDCNGFIDKKVAEIISMETR